MSGRHVVRWCFHTTAMVADYERTRDALVRLIGLRVLEDSRLEDPAIGRRGGMAWVGDNVIEIGEPIVAGGAVDRFVQRFGSHMSSIALQVEDLDATLTHLEGLGVRVASRVGAHIAFTNPADTAGIVIEWFDHDEPLDPRFGAPMPPPIPDPLIEVEAMAFGGAVVDDPSTAAVRLSELIGHGVAFSDDGAAPGAPAAGVSMGDCVLALYRRTDHDTSRALWDWSYERAQTCNLGVLVDDLDLARSRLHAGGVAVFRDAADALVISPAETGGVTLVVVDRLLAGDPRATR